MGQKVPGPPRRYRPLPKDSPPPKNIKKSQPQENIPLQNSPALLKSGGGVHTLFIINVKIK